MRDRTVAHPLALQHLDAAQTLRGDTSSAATPSFLTTECGHPTADPAQIRAFAQAVGQRTKTDPIDSGVIAHFGKATAVTPRPLPDQATQQLADLVAPRPQIVDMIAAERQREKRVNSRIKKSIGRLAKALERDSRASRPILVFDRWRDLFSELSRVFKDTTTLLLARLEFITP